MFRKLKISIGLATLLSAAGMAQQQATPVQPTTVLVPGATVPEQKPISNSVPQPAAEATAPATPVSQKEIVIGPGDLLEVSVYGAPDYKHDLRVSSAGSITLPLAGTVKLAGLPVSKAEETIADQLRAKGIFNQPQVSVFEKEYATQGISVLGEVQKPGTYPLMGPHNLLEVISAAGGTTPKAGDTATITHREKPDQLQTVKLGNNPGTGTNNVAVSPGDTVVVAKAGIVYVVGDVKEPAGIVMDMPKLTVLQAVAMVHGTNSTAKLSASKLIRSTPSGPQEIPIPLNKILSAKSPDMVLQAGDILYIPTSTAKSATRRGLEAILQAATGVAIYRP